MDDGHSAFLGSDDASVLDLELHRRLALRAFEGGRDRSPPRSGAQAEHHLRQGAYLQLGPAFGASDFFRHGFSFISSKQSAHKYRRRSPLTTTAKSGQTLMGGTM
jgi:hypothetical protein